MNFLFLHLLYNNFFLSIRVVQIILYDDNDKI